MLFKLTRNTNNVSLLTYCIAFLFLLYACYACIHSIYYAVEPYDEAFYLAESYRLTFGDYFYTYFHRLGHFSSLFNYPFIKVFVYLKGNTDGIFLYSRYVYSLFSIAGAAFIAYLLKHKFTFPISLIIASICIFFVPFNMHAMSYNTLGMLFLTLSLFLNFYAVSNYPVNSVSPQNMNKIDIILFASSLFQFFSICVYPPLLVIYPITIISLWFLLFKAKKNFLYSYLLGMAVGGFSVLLLLLKIGIQPLFTDMAITVSYGVQGGGINKILNILYDFWVQFPHRRLFIIDVIVLFIITFSLKFKQKSLIQLLLIMSIFALIRTNESTFYIRYLALISSLLFIIVKENQIAKNLFYITTIPSLIAGLVTSWSSSNGAINSIIGFLPAALTTLCFFVLISKDTIRSKFYNTFFIISALIIIIYPLKAGNQLRNYGDLPNNQLPEKITKGVFSGIYTTQEKKNYYETLQKTIVDYSQNNKSILFFDDFPLGYLMTRLIPATNSTWTVSLQRYPNYKRSALIDYQQNNQLTPDLIVKIIGVAENPDEAAYSYKYALNDPLNALIKQYKIIFSNNQYLIFKKLNDVSSPKE